MRQADTFRQVLRRICLAGFALLTFVVMSLAYSSSANAATSNANNFYFDDFTADYYLYRDEDGLSRMVVVEELTAIFPSYNQNHGITRIIPFTNNDGRNLTMQSDNTIYMDVERNGITEPVSEVLIGDGYFEVYIGDADKYVTGEQVYNLIYDYENVTLEHEKDGRKFQELYWDSNGTGWSQRFNSVTARVHLDKAIAEGFSGETSCYVGKYGAKGSERCEIKTLSEEVSLDDEHTSDTVVVFSARNTLSAGENLTFVLDFADGTFAPARTSYRYLLVGITIVVALAAIATIILIILSFTTTSEKRKYYKGLFTKPEYVPMLDFTVAEMAKNYIGKGANGDPKVATLIELAVQHKIELVKTEVDGMFNRKIASWKIRVKTDTMNKQQANVLKILAGSNATLHNGQEIAVRSHTATSELTSLAEKFPKLIDESLVRKGLHTDPKAKKSSSDKTKSTAKQPDFPSWLIIAVVIWMVGWIALLIFATDYQPSYGVLIGDGTLRVINLICAIIMFIASLLTTIATHRYSNITEKGLDCSKYLEGLKLYMSMAEAERIKFLQGVKGADTSHEGVVKLYEKLLPYAIIFRMEKSWLDELGRYYAFDDVTTPTWYVGVGAFSAHEFSSAMMAASRSVSSTIASSTMSSSGSGGGGGGFSGGGGGGGGGGGW